MKAERITKEINNLIEQVTVADSRLSIGNDLIHLPTFTASCTAPFIRRVFTPAELLYCTKFTDPILRYASTWAAKEAVYKAVKQTDESVKLWWKDIEILRSRAAGKPRVQVKKLPGNLQFALSISHDGDYVWAIVICVY